MQSFLFMTFELCFVSVNFRLNFVRWFLWNDNEWSQGVHLDSWILLAKLNYALGNYTDSLKYYEKAQVKHIEDISKRQLEATCVHLSRSRASRKSNCLRGLSRSWLRLLQSKAFAMKNFLCRCKSHFKSILQLLIWFKPDDKQAQAAGEGEQGDQMLRAGWRPHPALPPGETLPSFCPETSSFKGNFLEAVVPSSNFKLLET